MKLPQKLITISLVLGFSVGLYASDPVNPSRLKAAESLINEWSKANPYPGISVLIANRTGKVWSKAWGLADLQTKTAMTPQTVLGVGSITKSFTAIAILQLVEKGKLTLDDPVIKYLPWFRLANKDVSDTITLRHCLNNASAIPSVDHWTQSSQNLDEMEIEKDVRALDAIHSRGTPGKSFEYANENWEILGLVIRAVSGQSYGRYMQDNVLDPMGMLSSTTDLDRLAKSGAIVGSWFSADGFTTAQSSWRPAGSPAGSCFVSNAEDFGAYISCLLNNGRSPLTGKNLLQEASLQELFKPTVQFPVMSSDFKGGDQLAYYAMGWIVSTVDGRKLIYHGGNTGRTSSMTVLDPANGYGISFLLNSPGEFDHYKHTAPIVLANQVLHILGTEKTSDWGTPLRSDPNLSEKPINPGQNRLQEISGSWLANDGTRLQLQPADQAGRLIGTLTDAMGDKAFYIDFIDSSRFVLQNPGGTYLGHLELQADGSIRSLISLAYTFKRQAKSKDKAQQVKTGPFSMMIPEAWQKIQETSDFSTWSTSEHNEAPRLRLGYNPSASSMQNSDARFQKAWAIAAMPMYEISQAKPRINGSWSGQLFWESVTIINGAAATTIVYCDTGAGLVWLRLDCPSSAITKLNRDIIRPMLASFQK